MALSWLWKPLATAGAVAFSALGVLSHRYQKARFYFQLTLYSGTLGAISVWGVVVSILASLAGQRLNINYIVARSFYYTCGPLIRWRFNVQGEEHLTRLLTSRAGKPQSAILVGNHQSFIDILYLGRIFPRRASIMAKQELKWMPLLGQYMTASGAVWVNRKDRKDAMKSLQRAGEDMKKKGVSIWIFPEGTRSLSAEPVLLPFKKGAFHLAIQAQVPIIPVVCENYHHLFDGRSRMDRGDLTIKVLEPISTEGLTADDVDQLVTSTQDLMAATLISISRPGPSRRNIPPPILEPTADDLATPRAELPVSPLSSDGLRQRASGPTSPGSSSEESESLLKVGSELRQVDSRGGETTEDEMDEDAVLMKRPAEKK